MHRPATQFAALCDIGIGVHQAIASEQNQLILAVAVDVVKRGRTPAIAGLAAGAEVVTHDGFDGRVNIHLLLRDRLVVDGVGRVHRVRNHPQAQTDAILLGGVGAHRIAGGREWVARGGLHRTDGRNRGTAELAIHRLLQAIDTVDGGPRPAGFVFAA